MAKSNKISEHLNVIFPKKNVALPVNIQTMLSQRILSEIMKIIP